MTGEATFFFLSDILGGSCVTPAIYSTYLWYEAVLI
jgi:hypothetical protein